MVSFWACLRNRYLPCDDLLLFSVSPDVYILWTCVPCSAITWQNGYMFATHCHFCPVSPHAYILFTRLAHEPIKFQHWPTFSMHYLCYNLYQIPWSYQYRSEYTYNTHGTRSIEEIHLLKHPTTLCRLSTSEPRSFCRLFGIKSLPLTRARSL